MKLYISISYLCFEYRNKAYFFLIYLVLFLRHCCLLTQTIKRTHEIVTNLHDSFFKLIIFHHLFIHHCGLLTQAIKWTWNRPQICMICFSKLIILHLFIRFKMSSFYKKIISIISKPPENRNNNEIELILDWFVNLFKKKSAVFGEIQSEVVKDIIKNCSF